MALALSEICVEYISQLIYDSTNNENSIDSNALSQLIVELRTGILNQLLFWDYLTEFVIENLGEKFFEGFVSLSLNKSETITNNSLAILGKYIKFQSLKLDETRI